MREIIFVEVRLPCHYKDLGLEICYVVLEKYVGWLNFQSNHCDRILQIGESSLQ